MLWNRIRMCRLFLLVKTRNKGGGGQDQQRPDALGRVVEAPRPISASVILETATWPIGLYNILVTGTSGMESKILQIVR